ncbi:hypothetical protein AG1IA_07942 [Rhizoctonia solani AG-1 IA]|uniref:Uncharacterized protein n=1 Tax=Thanatephorus cucumeris (strain AG1-IA) TaxID=983506 RepID=L8WII2_THACA|nr:hypothetical protein AG1IA_07942 [Rhizoctonia solani AG-1 IA]
MSKLDQSSEHYPIPMTDYYILRYTKGCPDNSLVSYRVPEKWSADGSTSLGPRTSYASVQPNVSTRQDGLELKPCRLSGRRASALPWAQDFEIFMRTAKVLSYFPISLSKQPSSTMQFHNSLSRLSTFLLFFLSSLALLACASPIAAPAQAVALPEHALVPRGTCLVCNTGTKAEEILVKLKADIDVQLVLLDKCLETGEKPDGIIIKIEALINVAVAAIVKLDVDLLGLLNGKITIIVNLLVTILIVSRNQRPKNLENLVDELHLPGIGCIPKLLRLVSKNVCAYGFLP